MISGSLEADVFRGAEIIIINDGDSNALALTQLTANAYIIDLRTEISFANMCLKVKGFSYIGLSTTKNITLYKDTTISGNLDVSKVLNLQRHPTESDTIPLIITNTSSSGSGFIGKCVPTVKGCLFE